MPNYKDSYFSGFTSQEEFRTAVEKSNNLKSVWKFVRYASSPENKQSKWDQLWDIDGVEHKIEVKGKKRQCRNGDFANLTVLELAGVSGSKGFLYGDASLAAFQNLEDKFIIVKISDLLQYISPWINTPTMIKLPNNKMPNKQLYYRVSQPRERCMFVNLSEIISLAIEIICTK